MHLVAVVDTGVDPDHVDLDGALVQGRNVIDGNAVIADDNGHGTGAAGVVAARTDNSLGVASFCWTCSIMPVKALDGEGDGTLSDVAKGIVWATDNGADVINLSLGASTGHSTLRDSVRYADDHGVLLVAAAGNEGAVTAMYPAAYAEVIAVAGSRSNDARYSWSNYGDEVDVAAPGCNLSTDLNDLYWSYCGTSSAAPVVAGIAGLAASAHTGASADQIRRALSTSAVDVGYVLHGRVDAHATLTSLVDILAEEEEEDEEQEDDTTPPQLNDLSFAPTSLDTTKKSDSATFTLGLTDDASGVAGAYIRLESPSGDKSKSSGDFALVVGDEHDGTWETTIEWSENAESGTWAIAGVELTDQAGNTATLTTSDLTDAGYPTELEIVSEEEDTTPPQLHDLSISPTTVDATGGSDSATFSLDVTDDVSGVSGVYLRVEGPSGEGSRVATMTAPVAGDSHDGTWEATFTWDAEAEGGTWTVARVQLDDEAGNTRTLTTTDLTDAGHPTELEVVTPEPAVNVLGGTGAISEATLDEIATITSTDPTRLAGPDRYATAAQIVADAFPTTVDTVYIATGASFPDALAGGPAAARHDAPLLLVTPDHVPDATADELTRLIN